MSKLAFSSLNGLSIWSTQLTLSYNFSRTIMIPQLVMLFKNQPWSLASISWVNFGSTFCQHFHSKYLPRTTFLFQHVSYSRYCAFVKSTRTSARETLQLRRKLFIRLLSSRSCFAFTPILSPASCGTCLRLTSCGWLPLILELYAHVCRTHGI